MRTHLGVGNGFLRRLLMELRGIGKACPYTSIGKKVFGRKGIGQETPKESSLNDWVISGRNIMLIGIFCPIFWYSFFSGVRGHALLLNAVHSGIVAGIGLVIMLCSKFLLWRGQKGDDLRPSPSDHRQA